MTPERALLGTAELLELAHRVLVVEADAIRRVAERLDQRFVRAVDLLESCRGRVVVTGIGKSGLIGRKLAATLAATVPRSERSAWSARSRVEASPEADGPLRDPVCLARSGASPEASSCGGFAAAQGAHPGARGQLAVYTRHGLC